MNLLSLDTIIYNLVLQVPLKQILIVVVLLKRSVITRSVENAIMLHTANYFFNLVIW